MELTSDEMLKLVELLLIIIKEFEKIANESSLKSSINLFMTLLNSHTRSLLVNEDEAKNFDLIISAIKLLDRSLNITFTSNPIVLTDPQMIIYTQAYRYGVGKDGVK